MTTRAPGAAARVTGLPGSPDTVTSTHSRYTPERMRTVSPGLSSGAFAARPSVSHGWASVPGLVSAAPGLVLSTQ